GTGVAEVLGPCRARGRYILRANEVGGDLHEVLDPHPGIGEDRNNVLPAGVRLRLDLVRHGSIRQHADFSRDVEQPRAVGYLDGMAVRAERRGDGSWSVADVHRGSFRLRGYRKIKG